MLITLIHPSRSRPKMAVQSAFEWLSRVKEYEDVAVRYVLGAEFIEIEAYHKECLDSGLLDIKNFTLHTFFGERLGYALPKDSEIKNFLTGSTKTNMLLEHYPSDWYVLTSDDTTPKDNWMPRLMPYLTRHVGQEAIIGYPKEIERGLLSHPVLTKEYLAWNKGKLLNEDYVHTHSDFESYWTAKLGKKLLTADADMYLEHSHPLITGAKWDELYKMNYSQEYVLQGARVWEKRKKEMGI